VAVALAVKRERPRLVLPWRVAVQVGGLVVVLHSQSLQLPTGSALPQLLAVAVLVGVAAAIANNLPVSVAAGAMLAGPSAYAATIGLAVGALATPHGSVATLIAAERAAPHAPPVRARHFTPLALVTLVATTFGLWTLS
jgi:arsenical pump membrane protein